MLDSTTIQDIIIAAISYVFGFLTCYFLRRGMPKDVEGRISIRENTFVLVVVTIIWAFSVIIDILSPQYETSPFIHGLMGAIVGFFYKPLGGAKKE